MVLSLEVISIINKIKLSLFEIIKVLIFFIQSFIFLSILLLINLKFVPFSIISKFSLLANKEILKSEIFILILSYIKSSGYSVSLYFNTHELVNKSLISQYLT